MADIADFADMAAYAECKRELLGSLTGVVLEIGAGTGANFTYLRGDIDWLGLEPHPGRRRTLARTAAAYGRRTRIVAGPAERIPLTGASVDAVVATIVLCSVTDQSQVLAEVRRVLKPGGSFVFFEHVAAPPGTWPRRLQRCWAPISRRLDAGCDPARETWRAITEAGFRDIHARWYTCRPSFSVYDPHLGGIAHV